MKKVISLKVNGIERSVEVEPRTTLLELVREQFNLTGAKLGCDIQVCGACTLLLDGKPVSACSVFAVDADGCEFSPSKDWATKMRFIQSRKPSWSSARSSAVIALPGSF